jgi:hypothetical protein
MALMLPNQPLLFVLGMSPASGLWSPAVNARIVFVVSVMIGLSASNASLPVVRLRVSRRYLLLLRLLQSITRRLFLIRLNSFDDLMSASVIRSAIPLSTLFSKSSVLTRKPVLSLVCIFMAKVRVDLDEAITKHNLAARDVLKVQEDIEKNNRFISDATLLSSIDEKKNQAALVAETVKRLGIENENLGKLMSAQAFMMNTQGALNQILGAQAREVIQALRLDNLDSANELSRNWDKRFDVEVPNPQYEKNLRSPNPIIRGNPGPQSFKVSLSLKDFHDKTVINQANASEFLSEQARVALRNAKLDPYVEISKALIGVAGSIAGAGIIRGGMAKSAVPSVQEIMTERYDPDGAFIGGTYVSRRSFKRY